MQSKDTQFPSLLNDLFSFIDEALPDEKPVSLLSDGGTIVNLPLTYKVDVEGDRSIIPQIQPPYTGNETFLSTMLSHYDDLLKPYDEPMNELDEIFDIDRAELTSRYLTQLIDEDINEDEKRRFYGGEVNKIFNEIISKDVERAALKMFESSLVHMPQYNLLSGQLAEFKDTLTQQILEASILPQPKHLTEAEYNEMLGQVVIDGFEEGKNEHDNQNEMIREYLEQSKEYVKKPMTQEEEEKKDLDHINIDEVIKRKNEQAQKIKDQQDFIKSHLDHSHHKNENLTKQEVEEVKHIEQSVDNDEIDVIFQDSSAFKQALEKSNSTMTDSSIVAIKSNFEIETILQNSIQKWYEVDESDMKRFNEMIPNPAISYPFELDDFQKRAVYRLEQGHCVFVAAHTSAGKTVVAEYAIALSQRNLTKTVYTSPIKALSNQKYREFKEKFGDVGISTGDVSLNPKASCVIMTTEVLQTMLYNDSNYLKDVEWVIFDEVHYINDVERGSVWEEVIMKLPDHIKFVMLSATVPNYKEFADWVGRVKRKKIYVQMTEKRPVPLQHLILYKDKLHMIKDEFGNVYQDKIAQVLKEEQNDNNKKKFGKEKEKGKPEEGKEEKLKKIDFKEKSLKAKENMIKKVAAKGMAQASGGGSGSGPNAQSKGNKKYEKFHKYLITISKEKLLPCIVFCFSRAACEDIPAQLDESLEFTTGQEKGEIKKFLQQKLLKLNEQDRNLPQIVNLHGLLVRGIGIHHAGLLPIVKELIEILFADGYLKVIFATTTFAIGLNLPARSVFFTQIQKFNGQEMELLQTSEYLQMAGRAGRRGKDATGSCLLAIDRGFGRLPTADDFTEILTSKGTRLESKLKLSYQITLNVVQQDDLRIEEVLRSSFFENEQEKERTLAAARAQKLQLKIQKAGYLECIGFEKEDMMEYYQLYKRLCSLNKNIVLIAKRDLIQLCILEVFSPTLINQYVVILKNEKDSSRQDEFYCLFIKDKYEQPPLFIDAEEESKINQPKFDYEGSVYFEYVWVKSEHIFRITDQQVQLGYAMNFNQNGQLPPKVVKDIINKFFMCTKSVKDWKLPNSTSQYIQEKNLIFDQLKKSPCHKSKLLNKNLMQLEALDNWEAEMKQCRSLLNQGGQEKLDDFKAKLQVLIHYKYLDFDLTLLFRGKVAQCFTSVDKFLITEFIFSGLLKELSNEEVAAIFSVLNCQVRNSKYQEAEDTISENFQKALQFLNEEALKLIEVESKFGVAGATSELSSRLNYCLYEIIYHWAKQMPFIEVVKLNTIDEGGIVKAVQNVEKICREVKGAARIIGDAALASRMDEITLLIKRDIIFSPSLYLE